MQTKPKTLALVTATGALTVAFAIFFAPQFTQSIAARDAQKITDRVPQAALETARLVPVDVLGTGVVTWTMQTGNTAN